MHPNFHLSLDILVRKYKNVTMTLQKERENSLKISFCFQTGDKIVIYVSTRGHWDCTTIQHHCTTFSFASAIQKCFGEYNLWHVIPKGLLWPWSYGSWIYNYLCNQCLSPLMVWVRISIGARCTTSCDKVCQWLATDLWVLRFPPPINWPPRYNWKIVEIGIIHHHTNNKHVIPLNFPTFFIYSLSLSGH
jgi:hypothetical protein